MAEEASSPTPVTPVVEKVIETKEKVTSTGEVAIKTQPPTPTPPDNFIRGILAVAVLLQFTSVIGYMLVVGTNLSDGQTGQILIAEVSFVTVVLSYFYGSSSGSTAKSAMLEKK
jgi:hypothetical protein